MSIVNNNPYINIIKHPVFVVGTALILLSGCTTIMSGSPESSDKSGIRYSLPAPHIFMNPQPDGNVTVEVIYLPDPNNTYTLNIDSYLAAATLDITLKDGMLTSLNLDSDSSAVPDKAVSVAAETQKQIMVSKQKKDEADQTKVNAKKAAIKTAADEIQKQKEKIALLEDKESFYKNHSGSFDSDALVKLQLDISQEKVTLQQLEIRLGLAKSKSDAFNDPTVAFKNQDSSSLTNAYGGVLFRVLPTTDGGVKLVAKEKQNNYQTSTSAKPPVPPQTLTWSPSVSIVKADEQNKDITFTFSEAIEIDKDGSNLIRPSDGVTAEPVIQGSRLAISMVDSNSKSLKLVLPQKLPKGVYQLNLVFRIKGGERQEQQLTIHWLED